LSTLKVNSIQHSNGTDALTIDSAGNTSFNGVVTGTPLSFRNIIINGDMRIAQRGTTPTTYSLSSPGFRYDDVDRFCVNAGNVATGQVSSEQISSTGLDGFPTAKRITVTTTEASPATNGYMGFVTVLEAQMLQHLKWGTSNAETLTLSFWVRSSITGTFGGNIIGTDSRPSENRTYPYNYTISSANTWEKKTITITGDIAGTMNNDTGQGFEMDWYLYLGSDYQNGIENTWNSNSLGNSYHDNTPKINLLATSGATFDITGVQLEVGDTATPFEHVPYDMNLARCQRYYYSIVGTAQNTPFGMAMANSTTQIQSVIPFPVEMRATPSLSTSSTASDFRVRMGGTNRDGTALPVFLMGTPTSAYITQEMSSGTTGQAGVYRTSYGTETYLAFSAEF